MPDMDRIMAIAAKHKLIVIEDAAQAIGAEDKGRRAGSIGHYGCFSFFPSKNLGGAGDGGMVVTNDAQRAEMVACLRVHGSKEKYYHKFVGGNFRLHALQAAVVTVKLRSLDKWTEARQKNAKRYDALFAKAGLIREGGVAIPKVAASRHIFNQYVIRVQQRDELKASLKKAGIDTEIYYPLPLHLQECFAYLGHRKGDFPESERASLETLALPIYPELSDDQAGHVVNSIAKFLNG
jgi:dTDP-4-amino-4,6-dideoxygalactose transaminase